MKRFFALGLGATLVGVAALPVRAATPPPVSKPVCVMYCGGASTPRSPTKLPSFGYKPSAAIGAAILGSLLDGLLDSPADSGPDPAVLARQEEERRQAEAEAQRRAEAERVRHEQLLGALKMMPLARSYTATPAAQGTTEQLGLMALRSLDAPVENGVAGPLDGTAEALRSEASLGWDTAADTRFAIRWQPLPLSKSVALPLTRPLCTSAHCAWPADPGSKIARLAQTRGKTHSLGRDAVVQLMGQPGKGGLAPDAALIAGLMARLPDSPGAAGSYVLNERLKRFAEPAAKELIWVFLATLLDASGTLGKGITLAHDVYELASSDMQDAIKVAGWLGSSSTDAPPEITSPEEASIPFLSRALGASGVFGEKAAEYAAAGIDAGQLANKLLSLWRGGP